MGVFLVHSCAGAWLCLYRVAWEYALSLFMAAFLGPKPEGNTTMCNERQSTASSPDASATPGVQQPKPPSSNATHTTSTSPSEAQSEQQAKREIRFVHVTGQLVSKLEKLFELKTSGVISELEFQEQKRKLLEGG